MSYENVNLNIVCEDGACERCSQVISSKWANDRLNIIGRAHALSISNDGLARLFSSKSRNKKQLENFKSQGKI